MVSTDVSGADVSACNDVACRTREMSWHRRAQVRCTWRPCSGPMRASERWLGVPAGEPFGRQFTTGGKLLVSGLSPDPLRSFQ